MLDSQEKEMPKTQKPSRRRMSDAELQYTAKCIAMVVRNAMEDFHGKHLSDAQMAELNPIIRNAIYTALHAMEHSDEAGAKGFMDFTKMLIPAYWEPPQLLADYLTSSEEQWTFD
jgi:hypothetical protein